jgi:hypothetical protein
MPQKRDLSPPHFRHVGNQEDAKMSMAEPPHDPLSRDLEQLLNRGLPPAAEAAPRHTLQRLQPTVLAPPPDPDGPIAPALPKFRPAPDPVSELDDLPNDSADENSARMRQLMFLGAGLAIALVGGVGYLLLGPVPDVPLQAGVPVIRADPDASGKASLPSLPIEPTAGIANAPPDPIAMGDVTSDLIAPSTEGLSPARKVTSIRIVVKNDVEVAPAR